MRPRNDDCIDGKSPPITPETIIRDFAFNAEMSFFEDNLHELFIEFVNSPEGCNRTDKDDIVFTYEILRRLIKQVKSIELSLKPQNHE
jgi:hypothetical protein